MHTTDDFAASPVLAVVFTCNTCPASQRYEGRLQAIYDEFHSRGLALVAINPNDPGALRSEDLKYSEVGESLDDMKVRAAFRRLTYPYLSESRGTRGAAQAFGVTAMPHIFVFDRARTLRYQGRIDDDPSGKQVKSQDARNAIEALLQGRGVATGATRVPDGCERTLDGRTKARDEELATFAGQPVSVEAVGADGLKALRRNGTGKLLMINFWATWCAPCVSEFPDLEATFRMYRSRGFDFVTVSTNDPQERQAVLDFLKQQHASHRNLQFDSPDVYALQAAFDPAMPAPVPFTLLLASNGDVLYQELGVSDIPKLRRAILANLPADSASAGQQAYWSQP